MYQNIIITAGVGVYRISLTKVWPAFINSALWTLFGVSKEEFVQSIELDNILGGKYTQRIDLINNLCSGEPIQNKSGVIDAIGLSTYNIEIPLEVIYYIFKFDEETSLLFVLICKVNSEANRFGDILKTFDINSLVFSEMDEVGLEYDRISQCVKLRTVHFRLESCWTIDDEELAKFLLRFIHPEDHTRLGETLASALEKPDYGNISIRLRLLNQEYQAMEFWYSSSIDQNGNVNKICGIIEQEPAIKQEEKLLHVRSRVPVIIDNKILLHLEFNMDTNLRIRSKNDLETVSFPCGDYQSVLTVIKDVFLHENDINCIEYIKKRYAILRARAEVYDFYCCDVRMLSCIDKIYSNQAGYRWYHIVQELLFDIRTRKTLGFISIYDIDDTKYNEYGCLPPIDKGASEHMLNLNGFFTCVTNHLFTAHQTKDLLDYSALVLVKIKAESNTDDNLNEAIERTAKTINAFIHKDEFYCDYSEDIFALFLHTHQQSEIFQERIHMLDLGLSSDKTAGCSTSVNIGYSVICDSDHNSGSTLLKEASIALFWTDLPNCNRICQYTKENEARIIGQLSCGTIKSTMPRINKNLSNVSIRTFGTFDVFVDGQPIPFSNEKAKELLAVLVDHREGFVTPSQAISYLWEDEPCNQKVLSRLRKVALLLKRQLEKYEIGNLIESVNGRRRLVIHPGVQCDYYELLSNSASDYRYYGTYMPEYSWAESTNAILEIKYNYYANNISDIAR